MASPATQILMSGPPIGQHLYTLKFKNGQVLRHQDLLALSQFRSDGRLADVLSEPPTQAQTEGQTAQEWANP